MRSRRAASRAALAFALDHHEDRAAISGFTSPTDDRPWWTVWMVTGEAFEFTYPEVEAFVLGLAAGEALEQRNDEAEL
jgi:hypothetical protein